MQWTAEKTLLITNIFFCSSDNFVPKSESEEEKPKKKRPNQKKGNSSDDEFQSKKIKKGNFCTLGSLSLKKGFYELLVALSSGYNWRHLYFMC